MPANAVVCTAGADRLAFAALGVDGSTLTAGEFLMWPLVEDTGAGGVPSPLGAKGAEDALADTKLGVKAWLGTGNSCRTRRVAARLLCDAFLAGTWRILTVPKRDCRTEAAGSDGCGGGGEGFFFVFSAGNDLCVGREDSPLRSCEEVADKLEGTQLDSSLLEVVEVAP